MHKRHKSSMNNFFRTPCSHPCSTTRTGETIKQRLPSARSKASAAAACGRRGALAFNQLDQPSAPTCCVPTCSLCNHRWHHRPGCISQTLLEIAALPRDSPGKQQYSALGAGSVQDPAPLSPGLSSGHRSPARHLSLHPGFEGAGKALATSPGLFWCRTSRVTDVPPPPPQVTDSR